jgi:hypothetical protein
MTLEKYSNLSYKQQYFVMVYQHGRYQVFISKSSRKQKVAGLKLIGGKTVFRNAEQVADCTKQNDTRFICVDSVAHNQSPVRHPKNIAPVS